MFVTVFRSGGEASEILSRAVSGGGSEFDISIVSDNPEFLSLPWELMNDPDAGYIAARATGVGRSPGPWSELPEFAESGLSDKQFNVLMLCPPAAEGIATEALGAMESLDVEVSLDCLSATSVEALEEHLSQRAGHYHLLHLDGVAIGDAGAEIGGVGDVERIGQAAAKAGIPVVLVASSTQDDSRSAAKGLAGAGVPEVAVVPVPLGGSGRKLFADAFYAGIARGAGAATAVAAARRAMMEQPHRPSAAGPYVSWDWVTCHWCTCQRGIRSGGGQAGRDRNR